MPARDDAAAGLDAILSQGNEDLLAGKTESAKTSYERVLELDPRNARAHYMLSGLAFQGGDIGSATALAQTAITLEPLNADFHGWLAGLHASHGRVEEAIYAYQEAVRLEPDSSDWRVKLAAALIQSGRLNEAVSVFRGGLAPGPADARAYFDLGDALLKHGELTKAEPAFQQAATMDPESGGLHFYLAMVRRDQHRPVDAEGPARRAIAVAPDMPQGWFGLGSILARQARHAEAVEHFRKAIALKADYQAAWDGLLFSMNWSEQWSPHEVYEAHVAWGKRFSGMERKPVASLHRTASRRIRVGYLSGDFRLHSVAYFIEPVLQYHDRARFEVFCYQNSTQQDAVTARLKGWVEHWRSVGGASDEEAERVLREDELDILVELSGHTEGHRLEVLARRVAPVQVTYLGYPNTTGITAIDYRITDVRADPPGESDKLHVEELVRLPETFLCYAPPETAPGSRIPPCRGRGYITFGSFNNFPKISPTCVTLWANVLSAVPESKLYVKTNGLQDPGLRAMLLERLCEAGIESDRVLIAGPILSHRDHLAAYEQIDIALDTFPYHGTTTTLDALWMGAPVLTLAGDRHASRVGLSILSTLGLTELVARTPDEYVAAAVQLSGDADKLDQLGRSLRARLAHSALTDGRGFTANLEAAYLKMLQEAG